MARHQVEAFVMLARGEVDCRRAADVSKAVANSVSMRILMVLFIGPMNRSQLTKATGASRDSVGWQLRRMRLLGLVDSERNACFNVFSLTPQGRKLLEALAECAT